jgi:hypothetical protein
MTPSPPKHEILKSWNAPGYRHAALTVDGKEVEFTPDQVLETWLFFGEVLGLAWANHLPLDAQEFEKTPPPELRLEIEKWQAIRARSQGASPTKN